jgi:hypothetical protein
MRYLYTFLTSRVIKKIQIHFFFPFNCCQERVVLDFIRDNWKYILIRDGTFIGFLGLFWVTCEVYSESRVRSILSHIRGLFWVTAVVSVWARRKREGSFDEPSTVVLAFRLQAHTVIAQYSTVTVQYNLVQRSRVQFSISESTLTVTEQNSTVQCRKLSTVRH